MVYENEGQVFYRNTHKIPGSAFDIQPIHAIRCQRAAWFRGHGILHYLSPLVHCP